MLLLFAIPAFAGGLLAAPIRAEIPALANTYCPVMTDERVEERYPVDYEGRTVYFCCDKCRRKPLWHEFSRFCITLGALGALVAAPLGWLAGGAPGPDALTEWHRWLGLATYGTSFAAAFLSQTIRMGAYRVLLLASVLLVAVTGRLGSILTREIN
jgi:hypothetical protein